MRQLATGFGSCSGLALRCGALVAAAALAPAWAQKVAPATRPAATAVAVEADPIVDAREAMRRKDRVRLAALRSQVRTQGHALALWVDYWELLNRLTEASVDEVEAFYGRHAGSYVEDRMRNDWLLELGRRRDWPNLARDYPRFRMNDDREVSCYALLVQHQSGQDVREAARALWWAQRDQDDGCHQLALALWEARRLAPEDIWRKARLALESNRPGVARAAVALLGSAAGRAAADALDEPLKFLRRQRAHDTSALHEELGLLALLRVAANDPDVAARLLEERWTEVLGKQRAAWAWIYVGRQSAFRLQADAADQVQRAFDLLGRTSAPFSADTLAWAARAALRSPREQQRWPLLLKVLPPLQALEPRDPAWSYWAARARLATAAKGDAGQAQRDEARAALAAMASPLHFYGQHAAEDLGQTQDLPAAPPPPTDAERQTVAALPGLQRALALVRLNLRDEARREWNFTLRGMTDRDLLAAARLACDASDWQLCINTSERSREQLDMGTRYPQPWGDEIRRAALAAGLEPPLVFGLIRQETRFMSTLRSSAGASGLMQLMPATARWMARKVGLEFRPEQVNDPEINLKLGTQYLKLVLDDLGGSQALATAAYNAGPGRPRRWRDGPVLEAAAWVENIPFNETRDYVKRVLANAAVYARLQDAALPLRLKPRLGAVIGPRDTAAPPPNADLP
ncbi:MAG: transglycosylase SLT domain-containing protein [Aquabacterium sp.]